MNPTISESLSIAAICISFATLILHVKNRRTNLKNFSISRENYRRASFDFFTVGTKQFNDHFVVKLAIYNTSSTKLILRCVKSYIKEPTNNIFQKLLGRYSKWRSNKIKWWPSNSDDFPEEQYLEESYRDLIVKDCKIVYVKLPGYITRNRYKFEVITSFDTCSYITTIGGSNTSFNLDYRTFYKGRRLIA